MRKTFGQAVRFIESYIPRGRKKHPGELGLLRMKYFTALLGNPQLEYKTVHLGGTSGKGSTAMMITSILGTKYRVGLYTSPHLVNIRERIQIIDNCELLNYPIANCGYKTRDFITEDKFIKLLNDLQSVVRQVEKSKFGRPTYFEIIAAMAFLYFKKKKVDFAVIEVGMGGMFDATNIVRPKVVVLTNVGLDHTDVLGRTIEEIAKDKVGIIKSKIPIVSGVRQSSVIEIVKDACKKNNAQLSLINRDFHYQVKKISDEETVFDYFGNNSYGNLRLSLLGEHQAVNAAVAIRAMEELSKIEENDIRKVLKSLFIPGRLQVVSRKPLIILDGAHNADKTDALVQAIKDIFPKKKIISVIAIKQDKDAKAILERLSAVSRVFIFTQFSLTYDLGKTASFPPEKLMEIARKLDPGKEIIIERNSRKAVVIAKEISEEDSLILITGSLYLIGEVMSSSI